jgi:transcription elongation factor GreB
MSKAFTKDDAAEEPLVVRPRPPLPPDAPNYVTPRGLAALREERRELAARLDAPGSPDGEPGGASEVALAHAVDLARARDLDERIASAVVVDTGASAGRAPEQVRFGARVTVRSEAGVERTLEIVGVDEADVAHGRVAFVAPVARALLGRSVGDSVTVTTPRGDEELQIVAIA